MTDLGYFASSEEHGPAALAANVGVAEDHGIDYAMISDHFHPWVRAQGESPFIWGVLGAMAETTEDIPIGTAVTAPIIRIHPAIVAQAAATAAVQLTDRFIFGVGTGENLNEHVTGQRWPPHDRRLDMLEEAIEIIQLLWEGGEKTYRGDHYTVENAWVFTLPDERPPIHIGASGERAAAAAGHYSDGLITTAPLSDLIDRFAAASDGADATHYGQLHVCYDEDEAAARETAYEQWPNGALTGELTRELATPAHFEQAAEMVDPEDVADSVVIGPDPADYIEAIGTFVDAGYDGIHVHQIGPEQEAFLEFFATEVIPSFD